MEEGETVLIDDIVDFFRRLFGLKRLVRNGSTYTIDDERAGRIQRVEPEPRRDPPPEDSRGEPWLWPDDAAHPHRPRGWRTDGDYYGGKR